MSYKIVDINDGRLIIIRMIAPMNPLEDLTSLYRETDSLVAGNPGVIYRIVDLTQAQLNFDLVMELLDCQRKNVSDTAPRSARVKNFYVATDQWGRFLVESLKQAQYGSIYAPMFASVEEALHSVHQHMKNATIELHAVLAD